MKEYVVTRYVKECTVLLAENKEWAIEKAREQDEVSWYYDDRINAWEDTLQAEEN